MPQGVAGVDLDKVVRYVEDNGGAGNLALGLHKALEKERGIL
jgi:hypothetical protein